jgi:hypothetical protein
MDSERRFQACGLDTERLGEVPMSMTLRGMGADKSTLVMGIYHTFGYHRFSFNMVKTLPGFDRASFFTLVSDKIVLRVSKVKPLQYQLSKTYPRTEQKLTETFMPLSFCYVDSRNLAFTSGTEIQTGGAVM